MKRNKLVLLISVVLGLLVFLILFLYLSHSGAVMDEEHKAFHEYYTGSPEINIGEYWAEADNFSNNVTCNLIGESTARLIGEKIVTSSGILTFATNIILMDLQTDTPRMRRDLMFNGPVNLKKISENDDVLYLLEDTFEEDKSMIAFFKKKNIVMESQLNQYSDGPYGKVAIGICSPGIYGDN
ncbi:MAG: hypothetical protein JST_000499 [Candidatus Parcubacteria bacterium]|jgi:hypothetical protein